jgi:hypothetical protein
MNTQYKHIMLRILELVVLLMPTVIAHYFNNIWIAYALYTLYFVSYISGLVALYEEWKHHR